MCCDMRVSCDRTFGCKCAFDPRTISRERRNIWDDVSLFCVMCFEFVFVRFIDCVSFSRREILVLRGFRRLPLMCSFSVSFKNVTLGFYFCSMKFCDVIKGAFMHPNENGVA